MKKTKGYEGFFLMLAGPMLLILAGLCQNSIGDFAKNIAYIIAWAAVILPGCGFAISIVSLFRWKKIGMIGRVLSIVTVVICNPIFFFFYFIVCMLASSTLAGLSWM